jgi:radical SAM protein with 4Fe4S-binding SPASM domain
MIAGFHDFLRLCSLLTAKRFLNLLRLYLEFWISKYSRRVFHQALPFSLSYEPTTQCNLKCPMCPSGLRQFSRQTGFADGDDFYAVVDEIGAYLMYMIFYFQGEPFMNKKIFDWIAFARQKNIYTATSTNAHYLTPENAEKIVLSGLDRLIVSIDGATQETYEKYRVGGNLEKAVKGIKNLTEAKKRLKQKKPFIILQNIVFKHNEHERDAVKALGRELGVDKVVFKTAQIYDYENGSDFIPDDKNFSRYEKKTDGTFRIKKSDENSCWKMWYSCVITWDGKVVPCCFDKDAHYQLGDLKKSSFRSIWFGEAYQNFRKTLVRSREEPEICQNCTEGLGAIFK